jgi:SAM-dependent methyltransferase
MRIWPGTRFVLQPSGSGRAIPFVRAAADFRFWPAGAEARIGRSVVKDLHPLALAAVEEICARRTNKPLRQCLAARAGRQGPAAKHLADWLLAHASRQAKEFPSEKQISYLFASGAYRARAISSMLEATHKTAIAHIVDIGTGVGLIPWLLYTETEVAQSVELFEPDRNRRSALDRLWSHRRPGDTYTIAHQRAENVQFSRPADLVMFCQCLFRIESARRRDVLARAWQSLRPGGILVVNEMPREEAARSNPLRDALITRNEIVSLMPEPPRLFTSRTGWRTAQEPCAVSPRTIGSSGLFVSTRPD